MKDHCDIINKMTAELGKRSEAIIILFQSDPPFDNTSFCLTYLVYQGQHGANVIWTEQVWTNQTDHAVARSTPQMQSCSVPVHGCDADVNQRARGHKLPCAAIQDFDALGARGLSMQGVNEREQTVIRSEMCRESYA
jgi:quinol monooxygenase YgiN